MMTYEPDGPAHFIVYYRLSDGGWDRDSPTNVGSEIRLPNGAFRAQAPRFTVMPDGAILLVAQLIETPELKLGARNGRVLLVNSTGNPPRPGGPYLPRCPCLTHVAKPATRTTATGALTTPPRCFPLRTERKCWNSPLTGRLRSASPPIPGRSGGPIPDLLRNSRGAPPLSVQSQRLQHLPWLT
jgi:hypothetical protein